MLETNQSLSLQALPGNASEACTVVPERMQASNSNQRSGPMAEATTIISAGVIVVMKRPTKGPCTPMVGLTPARRRANGQG
jgi:hypothetical protein